jgi:hypothetical protein
MICSSEKRFFVPNLRRLGDWTPNHRATQNGGDVGLADVQLVNAHSFVRVSRFTSEERPS